MPTPTKGPRLGGGPAHERLILANLATSLFEHRRITTTEAKARRLRPLAERLITKAKRGDMHARRQVLAIIRDKGVVHELFTEIGPSFAARPGGYTRIIKIAPRKGDNAPMAIIELVEALTVAQEAVGEAERARGTKAAPRKRATGATRESAEALAAESPTAAAVVAEETAADEAAGDESAVETPVEAATDEAQVDAAVDEAPVEAAADEAPVEVVADEAPVEVAAEEAPVEAPVEAVADEAPVEVAADETTDDASPTEGEK